MVERLQREAHGEFRYAQAVGPHLRHIIEHYTAMLSVVREAQPLVDYDARDRDMAMQSQEPVTVAKLRETIAVLHSLRVLPQQLLNLDKPMLTRLRSGPCGEVEMTVATTLGRELLFLASHTVHHFALLAHYCKAAGVDLGHDFGKAPATLAFERKAA